MAASTRLPLSSLVIGLLAAAALSGCATRYDSEGRQIYFLQFGQPTYNAVDYSNPRLPQLPRTRPTEILWEIPSPYQFLDLSQYSSLTPDLTPVEAQNSAIARVGDNPACAAFCDSNVPGALVVSRADVRDGSQSPIRR